MTYTTDYYTEWKAAKALPIDDDNISITDEKYEAGDEIYGIFMDSATGGIVSFELTKLLEDDDDSAISSIAQASFAVGLAVLAMAGF